MRVALDTNVLVYAEGVNGEAMRDAALRVLADLALDEVLIPVQALGELFAVLTRKAKRDPLVSADAVRQWSAAHETIATTDAVLRDALDLAARHSVLAWDAVILAAAASCDCRRLITEDLQPGFTWRRTVVHNPFARAD